MANKKIIIRIIFFLLASMILSPILLNFTIMSWSTSLNFGDSNDWLGFWGAMISSIFGGLISGGLTLGGVLLTINNKDKKDFINSYPVKKRNATKVLEWARDIKNATYLVISPSQGEFKRDKKDVIDYLKLLSEKDVEMLESAEKVNVEFYNYTDKIIYENYSLRTVMNFIDSDDEKVKEHAKDESRKYAMTIRTISNELENIIDKIEETMKEYKD